MSEVDIDRFLAEAPVSNLPSIELRLKSFVDHHNELGHRIVCITSGGTTVPLEQRCVRFIDNFSRGNRGAFSAEEFLVAGYAVIFVSRSGSAQPFTVDLEERLGITSLVDLFRREKDGRLSFDGRPELSEAVNRAQHARENNLLLSISFTTIFEYMAYLRAAARSLEGLKARAVFYLPAAVSDFYVPWGELTEHKIQSSDGVLNLRLHQVPKALHTLRTSWAPDAMVVSFKLETDPTLIARKAGEALRKYHVHMVVANILETRKDTVYLIKPRNSLLYSGADDSANARSDVQQHQDDGSDHGLVNLPEDIVVETLTRPNVEDVVIEEMLVSRVVEEHHSFCGQPSDRGPI